jgi:hypothetical protein
MFRIGFGKTRLSLPTLGVDFQYATPFPALPRAAAEVGGVKGLKSWAWRITLVS